MLCNSIHTYYSCHIICLYGQAIILRSVCIIYKLIVHLNIDVCSLLYLTYMHCKCEVRCTWRERLNLDRGNILIMNLIYHVFTCILKVYILMLSTCLLVSNFIQYALWKFTYKRISIGFFPNVNMSPVLVLWLWLLFILWL